MTDRPTIPIVGELVDNDEPKLSPEERVRAYPSFRAGEQPSVLMGERGEFIIDGVDTDAAEAIFARHAPWRIEVRINGRSNRDAGMREPFSPYPLNKLRVLLRSLERADLDGQAVLDIGSNAGYNALYLASAYGAAVTGIDRKRQNVAISRDLANIVGLSPTFILGDVEEIDSRELFDGILHLGTLYHLPNPMRSIERAARALKPGGWLALETMCYRGGRDGWDARWINGQWGDETNFWSLGEDALRAVLSRAGLGEIQTALESWPPVYERQHSRVIWLARRVGDPAEFADP
jgi:2-polyprenyl-3-methyl-5-hydroxy-6-metoxy-1,4-benzoquinol methylase